jgi:hypothetical protein
MSDCIVYLRGLLSRLVPRFLSPEDAGLIAVGMTLPECSSLAWSGEKRRLMERLASGESMTAYDVHHLKEAARAAIAEIKRLGGEE